MVMAITDAALAVFAYVNLVHAVALLRRDNSVMDIAWGPGFALVAWVGVMRASAVDARQLLLAVLVTVWGLRLAMHLLVRKAGRGEDFRYRQWRDSWGRWFHVRSYLQIYLLQGFFMMVVAAPVLLVTARRGGPLGWLDVLGGLVWLVGFLFEAIGDWQLLRFIEIPANRGRLLRQGLWRYTRHPNYFGEATLWWGCFLIALNVPGGWWAVASPLVIDYLLLFVSGIPMLEARYRDRPDFREYASTTSAFFPWFPRTP